MSIHTADKTIPLRGNFKMRVIDRDGNIIDTYEEHNTIVNAARNAMAMLVAGDGATEGSSARKVITKFAVGINGHEASTTDEEIGAFDSSAFPAGTTVSESEDLAAGYITKVANDGTPTGTTLSYTNFITGHTYPEDGVVTFSWHLDYDEAASMNIIEFGLVCNDGTLFARKTRPEVIYKGSDIAFDGEWSILF